jgi:hypothetical protein
MGARHAQQVGADHVHLQYPGVEADDEIADRRQQVNIVELRLTASGGDRPGHPG